MVGSDQIKLATIISFPSSGFDTDLSFSILGRLESVYKHYYLVTFEDHLERIFHLPPVKLVQTGGYLWHSIVPSALIRTGYGNFLCPGSLDKGPPGPSLK